MDSVCASEGSPLTHQRTVRNRDKACNALLYSCDVSAIWPHGMCALSYAVRDTQDLRRPFGACDWRKLQCTGASVVSSAGCAMSEPFCIDHRIYVFQTISNY